MNHYAYPDSEEEHKKRKKGSFQHKLFKVVILIIVAVFFYLIFSFLRIEFFKSNTIDYKFDLNSEKYNYLERIDNYFYYSKDNKYLDECDIQNFYSEHISDNKPCKISTNSSFSFNVENYVQKVKKILKENKITVEDLKQSKTKSEENSINLLGFVNKIGFLSFMETLEFNNLFFRHESENKRLGAKAILADKNYFFIQLEGSREFRLSPITQINKLKPKRDNLDSNNFINFNQVESEEDLFKLESEQENKENQNEAYPKILKVNLKENEILFVPSYFFIQEREFEKKSSLESNVSLKFEFLSNSRIMNSMFKVLFDDNLKSENDIY
jgi:hypothetical protein